MAFPPLGAQVSCTCCARVRRRTECLVCWVLTGSHLCRHCCPPGHLPLPNTGVTQQHTVLQPHALCCNRVPPVHDSVADGTRCNRLYAAALPCHWLHPIQSSEAKAPLSESRGVCAALWTRIGSDVSEAVPLAAPSIPAAGRAHATGIQDSVDVRVAGFGSELSRPTSASASASGLGSVHGPNTGPLPSVGGRGEMGHRGPSRWNLACCWGGLPGLACRWCFWGSSFIDRTILDNVASVSLS